MKNLSHKQSVLFYGRPVPITNSSPYPAANHFLSNLGKFNFSLFQEPVEMRCKCEDDLCQNIGWKMFNPNKQKTKNGIFMERHEPMITQKDLVCLPNSRSRNRGQNEVNRSK